MMPPDQCQEPAADQGEAGQVEVERMDRRSLGQADAGERDQHDADGHVDPEDPVPVETFGDGAAHDGPEGDGQAGHGTPGTECEATALRRDRGAQDRQRERQRPWPPPSALDRAGQDQARCCPRGRARRRGQGEGRQPDDEHAPPAEPIAQRGAGQEQDRERQRVGIDGPLEASSDAPSSMRMTGSAVVTTRLSRVTISRATAVMAKVQPVRARDDIEISFLQNND